MWWPLSPLTRARRVLFDRNVEPLGRLPLEQRIDRDIDGFLHAGLIGEQRGARNENERLAFEQREQLDAASLLIYERTDVA